MLTNKQIVTIFSLIMFGSSSAMDQHQRIEQQLPSIHSRSSLRWARSNSDKQFLDQSSRFKVIDSTGKPASVRKQSFGYLQGLERWSQKSAAQVLEIGDMSADQIRFYDRLVKQITVGNQSTTLKSLPTSELLTTLRNLDSLMAPESVLTAVAQEVAIRRSDKPFLLDQATTDLLNRCNIQKLSDIKSLLITGEIYSKHPLITGVAHPEIPLLPNNPTLDLSSLGITNLDDLEQLTDLSCLNTHVQEGVVFGQTAPEDIKTIQLADNNISQITKKDIRALRKTFPNVRVIDLGNNNILTLDKTAVQEMEDLKVKLDDNPLDLDLSVIDDCENVMLRVNNTPTAEKLPIDVNNDKWTVGNFSNIKLTQVVLRSLVIPTLLAGICQQLLLPVNGTVKRIDDMWKAHTSHLMYQALPTVLREIYSYKAAKKIVNRAVIDTLEKSAFWLAGILAAGLIHQSPDGERNFFAPEMAFPYGARVCLPLDLVIKKFFKRYKQLRLQHSLIYAKAQQNEQ